ncbi:MFS transporter [Baekduia soli]|uniref:MFS transporter n=1 Tax=Baekduia soli TaxID=496014 RepID=A0A5B8UBP4_9ACTN|nr:MFS transporter [Baekduia soli]QEC50475.1 MFS transporter [Baekduia soli]
MRARHVLLAVAAGLALADASVVTLALPQLLRELDTSVEGVASILGVYTVVLAAALLPAERLSRVAGAPRTAAAGMLVFAAASVVCGAGSSLGLLLAARGVQAVGGAAALVAVFALLEPRGAAGAHGRRLWLGAAVLASAVGPALGGALTEAFSWRSIFYVQAPVAALAAVVALREPAPAPAVGRPETESGEDRWRAGPAIGLALVSAALTAVLFLLVLLLVAGWDVAPLSAAAAVTVIPLGALAGARIGGDARLRAGAGCGLVAAGVLALAFLPDARLLWTVVPQAAAGLGMGLALPALGGELLPERDARDAARLLVLRHAGIALALLVLAPIVSADLTSSTDRARERGVAIVLDARLSPADKLRLAPDLLAGVNEDQPRRGLRAALAQGRASITTGDRAAYDALAHATDATLVLAVGEAFRTGFLVTGALALLAALALAPGPRPARGTALGLAAVAAVVVVVPLAYLGLHAAVAPTPVALRDPCRPRPLPGTGGVEGFLQDRALELLDTTACHAGSTREELVLALADDGDRRRFERAHGVDPRALSTVLSALLG